MSVRLGIFFEDIHRLDNHNWRPRSRLVRVGKKFTSASAILTWPPFSDREFTKILTLGLGLNPSFSISKTTGTAVAAIAACPANKDYDYTITWGLQDYQYKWHVVGTKTYGGWDPLMRMCDADQLAHKDGGTFPFDMYYPAKQDGAEDDSSAEVEFQCCTDSMSGTMPNNPVCPPAT